MVTMEMHHNIRVSKVEQSMHCTGGVSILVLSSHILVIHLGNRLISSGGFSGLDSFLHIVSVTG